MARKNELGKWGEKLAIDHYSGMGYVIEAQNWRMGHIEIDIIARKGNVLAFAEVKTLNDDTCDPLDAVTPGKKARMVAAANAWLQNKDVPYDVQFDLFAINGAPDIGVIKFEYIPDAFYPPLKTY